MNIAIFLPGWIGDVVMATPAIRALRQHFPDARLTGVAKPYVAGVVSASPWFDELLLGKSVFTVARQLRPRQIDLALLLSNSFRTAMIAWLSGCRQRVGFARHLRSWLLTDRLQSPRDEGGRIKPYPALDSYNEMARLVGCPDPGTRLELFTTPADEAAAERVATLAGWTSGREVIGINPGAAFGAAKCWPTHYWIDLGRRLIEQRGARLLVLAGPAEAALSQEIAAGIARPEARSLADLTTPNCSEGPPLSLGLSMALVRRLGLLVTTDSGPRHFAHAFGRPVVTLFGPTHIAWTETYHPMALHLQRAVPCGPCQQRVCPLGHHRCMTELIPEQVFVACEQLLLPGLRSLAG